MILTTALAAALLTNPFAPKAPVPTAAPSTAAAPAPAPAPDVLPKGLEGYSHPDVTAAMCKVVNTGQSQCTLPPMTAGRYVVEAIGLSTATPAAAAPAAAPATPAKDAAAQGKSDGAVQALTIVAGTRICGRAQSPKWTTGQHALRFNCEISVMTDAALPIMVVYEDLNATKDPRGPGISVRRLPWDGVVTTRPFVPQQ